MKKYLFLLLIFIIACEKQDTPDNEILNPDPPDIEIPNINSNDSPEAIVGNLTGYYRISDTEILNSRYLENERAMARNYLVNLLSKLALAAERQAYNVDRTFNGQSYNYIGENIYTTLSATISTDEFIIIGAHYDSVRDCPGANDNASGVAIVYSLLKQLQDVDVRMKNIIFAFFDQEEMGLIGSDVFANMLNDNGYNIHSVHTIDQIGWDANGNKAIELELPTEFLKLKYEEFATLNNIPTRLSDVDGTDHRSFRNLGYDAIGITEEYKFGDTTPHYHSSTDTYATIDFEYLQSTIDLMFLVIEDLVSE